LKRRAQHCGIAECKATIDRKQQLPIKRQASQSTDGRGSWRDNLFVERLWRGVKYEEANLHAHESVGAARGGLARYPEFHNTRQPHQSRGGRTPDKVYFGTLAPQQLAA
jgi:putative transposase